MANIINPKNYTMYGIKKTKIENVLLKDLQLYMGYDVYNDFLEIIDDIETGYAELEDYKKDPSVFDEEEIEFLNTEISILQMLIYTGIWTGITYFGLQFRIKERQEAVRNLRKKFQTD